MSEAELQRIEAYFADISGRGAADTRAVCAEVRRCWAERAVVEDAALRVATGHADEVHRLQAEIKRLRRLAEPPSLPPAEKSA